MTYPGGKGSCYQRIISLMPPHRTYIETHLGRGSVLRHKKAAEESLGFDLDPAVVEWWQGRCPPGCSVRLGDGVAYLKSRTFDGREFVYCDPPYLPETRKSRRRLYRYPYDEAQHRDMLDVLRTLPCMIMISGYPSELYGERLAGWQQFEIPGWSRSGRVIESVWLNYRPTEALHDYQHIGATFRERERIRRRRTRMLSRIRSLPTQERLAMIEELASADRQTFLVVADRLRSAGDRFFQPQQSPKLP